MAKFAWTMPSRFGHYGVAGTVRYPQSAREVDGGPLTAEFHLRNRACDPGTERTWTVGGEEVHPDAARSGCNFRLSFEREGTYEVGLHVEGNGVDDEWVDRAVLVQDFLIVAIGDSVASGEGNPDNRSVSHPVWQDRRCHRSALAGTARAAALIEDADQHSSVTFVHLACSGATIAQGLTGGYKGAQRRFLERPRELPAQLRELAEVAQKREVDAVLLSVGANDVGFANLVVFCATHGSCNGARRKIKPAKVGLPAGPKLLLSAAVAASLAQLPGGYTAVGDGLPKSVSQKRVFALEYFDPTHGADGAVCKRILGGVDSGELDWAFKSVLTPLNAAVRAAATKRDWHYVGGVAGAFAHHGYCAGRDRWVRSLSESLSRQGLNALGTLHPNEEGHAQIGELIAAELRPELLPGNSPRAPRSEEVQLQKSLPDGVVPASLATSAGAVAAGDDGSDLVLILLIAAGLAVLLAIVASIVLARRLGPLAGGPIAVRMIAVLGLLTVGAVLVWQATAKDAKPDATTLALLLAALLLLIAACFPKRVFDTIGRIQQVELWGVTIALRKASAIAGRFRPPPVPDDDLKIPRRPFAAAPVDEVRVVADELRRKLRFVWTAVLDHPETTTPPEETERPEERVVAELEDRSLLPKDEADLCYLLMRHLENEIDAWDPPDRKSFLDNAWQFAYRFATGMFDRYARLRFRREGWFVTDVEQAKGHRPDFAVHKDGRTLAIAARVAAPSTSIDRTVHRLARTEPPVAGAPWVIVVPDHTKGLDRALDKDAQDRANGTVTVVRIGNLLATPGLLFRGQ
ncbi:MAG TPA: GDSL-type esterase/lipase family protein [Thermoleophilaceae bacterium]